MLRYCHKENHFLHDLIARVFLQSLQYGNVVLGVLDAFVYAHHKHRQDSENPGIFCDCMKGRIRFMTAITPAYGHAYQATCLARHILACPAPKLPAAQAQSQISVSSQRSRSITRERGNDHRRWAIHTEWWYSRC